MSTDKGFQGWGPIHAPMCEIEVCECNPRSGDEKLLKFLYDNKHHTPFEMCGLTIEVQAPIFVFREWHRHRTQSYNELSARYTELPDLFYKPSFERMMNGKQSQRNKQGSEKGFDMLSARDALTIIERQCQMARDNYEVLLQMGVAREIARIIIPVAQYSRMRASANLRNWLHFLELRIASNAQWEIRQYANAVANIIEQRFPRTYQLFNVAGK
jgi:thymidylate synthase (FAD)